MDWASEAQSIHHLAKNVCAAPGGDALSAGGATAPARHLWRPHPQVRQHRPGEWGCQLKGCGHLSTPPAPLAAVRARQAAAPHAPAPCATQPRWLPGPGRGALRMTVRSLAPRGHHRRRRRRLRPPCRLYRHLPQYARFLRNLASLSALRRSAGGVGTRGKKQTRVKRRDAGAQRAPTAHASTSRCCSVIQG